MSSLLTFGIPEIITAVHLGWRVYHNCYLVAKEAPDEFRKLVEELFGLQDVLRLLRDGVGSDMVVRADDRRKKAIERVIVATVRTLRELEMLVNKYHRMGLSDDRRLWKQIRSRLQWTMEQGAIEGFRKRIQAHTYTLSLSMSMIGNNTLLRIENRFNEAFSDPSASTLMAEDDDTVKTIAIRDECDTESAHSHGDPDTLTSDDRRGSMVSPSKSVDSGIESTTPTTSTSLCGGGGIHKTFPKHHRPSKSLPTATGISFDSIRNSQDDIVEKGDDQSFKTQNKYYDDVDKALDEVRSMISERRQKEPLIRRPQAPREPPDPAHLVSQRLAETLQEKSGYLRALWGVERLTVAIWLRIGTWWLLKSRNTAFLLDDTQPNASTASSYNSNISIQQSHLDLLKASWILYNVILEDEGYAASLIGENQKLFDDLESSVKDDFTADVSTTLHQLFDGSTGRQNFSVWEKLQPMEDLSQVEEAPEQDRSPKDPSRWFTIEEDHAGDEDERVLFRTFVNAEVGLRRFRTKTHGAPYMLVVWAKSGESEPKMTLCNQSGTLNLNRDFTPDDIGPVPDSNGTANKPPPLELKFPGMQASIGFLCPADYEKFMARPKRFFDAVSAREPAVDEQLLYRTVLNAASTVRLPCATERPSIHGESCELRVLETRRNEGQKTTRRLVINSYAGEVNPWCTSYFLPIGHVQVKSEDPRLVEIRWSGLDHFIWHTDGNYSERYSLIYNPQEPNICFELLFSSASEAIDFRNAILQLSDVRLYDGGVHSQAETHRIYKTHDKDSSGRVTSMYRTLVTTNKRTTWDYNSVYYIPRDVDFLLHHSENSIKLPCVMYPTYLSDFIEKPFKPSPDYQPQLQKVNIEKGQVLLSFNKQEEMCQLMRAVTAGWSLKASRPGVFVSYKTSLLGKNNEKKETAEMSVWEREDKDGNINTRLLVRWNGRKGASSWLSASLHLDAHSESILPSNVANPFQDDKKTTITVGQVSRGQLIDVVTLTAVPIHRKNSQAELHNVTLRVKFRTFRDKEEFAEESGLGFP